MVSKTNSLPRVGANLLALAYISFVALGLPISLIGVAWPSLRAELSLPLDALGLLLISTTAGYMISTFSIARLISRFGIGSLLISFQLAFRRGFHRVRRCPLLGRHHCYGCGRRVWRGVDRCRAEHLPGCGIQGK